MRQRTFLAETYASITGMQLAKSIPVKTIRSLIHKNIERHARIIELTAADYAAVLDELSENDFRGGIVYDALIVRAAKKANVDRLVTFNAQHFRRLWPEAGERLKLP